MPKTFAGWICNVTAVTATLWMLLSIIGAMLQNIKHVLGLQTSKKDFRCQWVDMLEERKWDNFVDMTFLYLKKNWVFLQRTHLCLIHVVTQLFSCKIATPCQSCQALLASLWGNTEGKDTTATWNYNPRPRLSHGARHILSMLQQVMQRKVPLVTGNLLRSHLLSFNCMRCSKKTKKKKNHTEHTRHEWSQKGKCCLSLTFRDGFSSCTHVCSRGLKCHHLIWYEWGSRSSDCSRGWEVTPQEGMTNGDFHPGKPKSAEWCSHLLVYSQCMRKLFSIPG